MKQRLFLLFVVSILITTPALAHGVAVADVSTFGDPIIGATLSTVTSGGSFHLSVSVQVHSKFDAGAGKTLYTYVYSFLHDSTSDLIIATIFDMNFDPTLGTGYVGFDPFSADPDVGAALTFHFNSPANWSESHEEIGPALVAYAQSYNAPVEGIVYFGDNTNPLEFSGFALTLGPGDPGSGAGLGSPVPEPASLLLLTSGLLSGGYLRFRKKRSNFKRTEKNYEE